MNKRILGKIAYIAVIAAIAYFFGTHTRSDKEYAATKVAADTLETIATAAPEAEGNQTAPYSENVERKAPASPQEDASGFVVLTDVIPDAILEIRYHSNFNFIGTRIRGYDEPIALITKEAANALKAVSDELMPKGYCLKIFDVYRPQCAVDHFMEWGKDLSDTKMKQYFYPEISKESIIPLGYVARKSGHTRGSTVDLTLFDMNKQKEVDMGCTYDYFGSASHSDVQPGQAVGSYKPITKEQYDNRMLLRQAMLAHGFRGITGEWWHFTLRNEPYPDTYFTFPNRISSVK